MKKLQLLTAIVFLCCTAGWLGAQISIGPQVGILSSGYNFANDNNEPMGMKNRIGIQGGMFANFPIGGGGFAIQPEASFSQFGIEYTAAGVDAEQTLHYFTFPLMLQYNVAAQGFGFFVEAGPYASLLINELTETQGVEIRSEPGSVNLDKQDFGFQMGLGFSFPTSSGAIFLNGRYILGINDIEEAGAGDIKNDGISVSVGYRIHLGKKE